MLALIACNGADKGLPDSGGADARPDVSNEEDAASDAPTGVCGPVDVTSFEPTPLVPPNPPHQDKCTSQQTSDYAQCQAGKVTSLCQQFADGQSGQACRQCIETQSTDQRWGVIVFEGTTGTINVEGCVDDALAQASKEKENDGGTGSCGDLLHASYGCQDAACAACGAGDLQACVDEAVSGGCKSYDQAVQASTGPCSELSSDAAPAALSACFPDDSISDPTQRSVDWLTRIVGYMCGP